MRKIKLSEKSIANEDATSAGPTFKLLLPNHSMGLNTYLFKVAAALDSISTIGVVTFSFAYRNVHMKPGTVVLQKCWPGW